MKRRLIFAVVLFAIIFLFAIPVACAETINASAEASRRAAFTKRLQREFGSERAKEILTDPRLAINLSITFQKKAKEPGKEPDYYYLLKGPHVTHGIELLQAEATSFSKTRKWSGAASEIIAGVLEEESDSCRDTGHDPVANTLLAIALRHPKQEKRAWATDEFIAFFKLSNIIGWNEYSVLGSRAGAIGCSQHLPSSYLKLIKSLACGASPDLWELPDAICSVGSYLKRAGLNGNPKSASIALFAYNHDNKRYVRPILAYAEKLHKENARVTASLRAATK
jgi:membrane-bound lytic murein transglycosylase B